MSKIIYKSDLIKALKGLPNNAPIWLGVDSGEGYTLLEDIFVCNAEDAPLDGDECSDWEIEYVDHGKPIPEEKSGKEFLKVLMEDGTTAISGPIIVIGCRGSRKEVENIRFARENAKEIKTQELLKQKQRLEEAMCLVESQLKSTVTE